MKDVLVYIQPCKECGGYTALFYDRQEEEDVYLFDRCFTHDTPFNDAIIGIMEAVEDNIQRHEVNVIVSFKFSFPDEQTAHEIETKVLAMQQHEEEKEYLN